MYVCILNPDGELGVHRHMQARPDTLLKTIAPYREELVIAVECVCPWYWLADLCARAGSPCVLGHALSMQALHGGKAQNDQSDAHKRAVLLRGGMLPQASVYPAAMRATRALLRRRRHLMRKRAALLGHSQHTHSPYNLPEIGKQIADNANRAGIAERFPEPAVQKSIAVDLALRGHYHQRLRDVQLSILNTARQHNAQTLSLLRTVPGSGELLRLVLRYEIHDSARVPRGQDVLAYCRLVKCTQEAAGKRSGTSGAKSGHAHRKGACSEVAGLFLRATPAGQNSLTHLEKQPGAGQALPLLAQQLGRAGSYLFQRQTACEMGQLLNGSGSGADEPHASLDNPGLSLRVVLCKARCPASLRVSLRHGTRRST